MKERRGGRKEGRDRGREEKAKQERLGMTTKMLEP
jgi:hypothetical protein